MSDLIWIGLIIGLWFALNHWLWCDFTVTVTTTDLKKGHTDHVDNPNPNP